MSNLDFWNRPDWLGDSRDNPRDSGFEPFWMRDEAKSPPAPQFGVWLAPAKVVFSENTIRHDLGYGVIIGGTIERTT